MSKLARDHRNRELAKIHLAKAQLGMTDDDYRAMLWTQGRVHSAKDLDHAGRSNVLDYLKQQGFKEVSRPGTKHPARPTPSADKLKQVRRIRAQLISLDRLPDTYADGISKQMFQVDFYEWCTPEQLQAIIAALAVKQHKEGAPTR